MPRQDCFEIDYSLGRAARFSKGACCVGTKKKREKDSATKQILAKSNFLLQLPDDVVFVLGRETVHSADARGTRVLLKRNVNSSREAYCTV